jgi:hypothetical protein
MRFVILFAAVVLPASSAAAPPPAVAPAPAPAPALPQSQGFGSASAACVNPNVHQAEGRGTAEAKRLGELPPANLYLSVMREVDGCNMPVIVNYGVGAASSEGGSNAAKGRLPRR